MHTSRNCVSFWCSFQPGSLWYVWWHLTPFWLSRIEFLYFKLRQNSFLTFKMKITFLCWDYFRRQLFLSSKFGGSHLYFVPWANIFKTSKRFTYRLLDVKMMIWTEDDMDIQVHDETLEISLCGLWIESKISYLAWTWHTPGKETKLKRLSALPVSCPIQTWYEWLLLCSASKENKWMVRENDFQCFNGKLKKMHQNWRLHDKSISSLHSPFGLGQPLMESVALE